MDDGAEMAKKINAIDYVEFSSIEIEQIQEIYYRVIKLAMESNTIHKKKTKTSNAICNCVIMWFVINYFEKVFYIKYITNTQCTNKENNEYYDRI